MPDSTSPPAKGDYLTRLTGLAGRFGPSGAALPDAETVSLRPRLPSRFEELPDRGAAPAPVPAAEDASEAAFWGEEELEAGSGASAPERRDLPRPTRAAVPPRGVTTPEPGMRPEPGVARESSRPGAPAARKAVPPQTAVERPEPVRLGPAPAVAPPRAPVTPPEPEGLPSPGPAVPGAVRPPQAEPRVRRVEAASEAPAPEPPRVTARRGEPARQPAGGPPVTLRPVPGRTPDPREEPEVATAPSRVGEASREGRRAEERRRAEPLPPVIQVTIGRIEVRSPAPPPAPAAQPSEPVRPAVSLEEYLQRRAEGRY